ncbi:hypothetical protein [Jiangella alkaliphila]|uniref:Uncharacterized protein n=1 Tax=Jiangella alkaliphila TaxID=419479 RepID=A0A1H2LDW4_9ACTN|nr:hypothetical protein [Jiangella alkaliphila]SDU78925.1 hypothetical protein SAMN04488563_5893 [Jiangella alkaliphila]
MINSKSDRADQVKWVSLVIGVVFLIGGISMGSPIPVAIAIFAFIVFAFAHIQGGRP